MHDDDRRALIGRFDYDVFPGFQILEAVGPVSLEVAVLYVKTKPLSLVKHISLKCSYVEFRLPVSVWWATPIRSPLEQMWCATFWMFVEVLPKLQLTGIFVEGYVQDVSDLILGKNLVFCLRVISDGLRRTEDIFVTTLTA